MDWFGTLPSSSHDARSSGKTEVIQRLRGSYSALPALTGSEIFRRKFEEYKHSKGERQLEKQC